MQKILIFCKNIILKVRDIGAWLCPVKGRSWHIIRKEVIFGAPRHTYKTMKQVKIGDRLVFCLPGSMPPQRFLDVSFIFQYLFTPSIFAALVLLFLGRFLTGSPLSVLGVTQSFVIVTVLSLAFTLVLETLVFKQVYDVWTYAGIILGLASVALTARGMTFS